MMNEVVEIDSKPVLEQPRHHDNNLETDVLYFIKEAFPKYYHPDITDPKKEKIAHYSLLFNEFKDIGEHQEKHSLKWAFKTASESFQLKELQHPQHQTDCFVAYDDVVSEVYMKAIARINKMSRRFSYFSLGVSFAEISISLLLIMLFTLLTHQAEQVFNTVLLTGLLIVGIAITKVTLDRKAIFPTIDRHGWRLFNRAIATARLETIKLNAILLVLLESINRQESVETRLELITEQKRKMLMRKRFTFRQNLEFPQSG